MKLNKHDFNLERMAIEDWIYSSTPIDKLIAEIDVIHTAHIILGISADAGSGIEGVFNQIQQKKGKQFYQLDCTGKSLSMLYGDLMILIGFGNKHVNWHTANYGKILEGLVYYLHETNMRPLFLINNCDEITRTEDLIQFLNTLNKFEKKAGVLFRISERRRIKLLNNQNKELRTLISSIRWTELPYPTAEELSAYCKECGIISDKVIWDLLKDNPDIEILEKRLTLLRLKLREEKLLKPIKS